MTDSAPTGFGLFPDSTTRARGLDGIRRQLEAMVAEAGDGPAARERADGWREAIRMIDDELARLAAAAPPQGEATVLLFPACRAADATPG
ncbi:MAG: hypothetical protein ACJ762_06505 [Solirubrobacteraceae bacterium]